MERNRFGLLRRSEELNRARSARVPRLEREEIALDALQIPHAGRMDGDHPAPAADEIDPRIEILRRSRRNDGLGLEPGPPLALRGPTLPPGGELGLPGRGVPEEHHMGAAPEGMEGPWIALEIDDFQVERPGSFLQHESQYIGFSGSAGRDRLPQELRALELPL